MFSDKAYYEINREERFFCSLFAHALLSSAVIREDFKNLVYSKLNIELNPRNLEVYIETAVLRDYWYDLGDPKKYSEKTHQFRKSLLKEILRYFKIPEEIIYNYDFFWTTPSRNKLWSPGRWSKGKIEQTKLDQLLQFKLIKLKWSFNAKPDIMIISENEGLLIEAKLESGEGRDSGAGYNQREIQDLIAILIKEFIPAFKNSEFRNISIEISPKDKDGISWKEILDILKKSKIDEFTKKCFLQLQRYYQ